MSKFGATIQIGAAYGNSACKPGSFRKSGSGVTIAELTQKQLDEWGIKHHELRLGKPFADIYVDDRGVSDGVFFDGH